MKVFAKWFYGFDPVRWPVVTFTDASPRSKLLRESAPGDVIVFVGTQGPNTAEEDRGRILGMAQFGRKEIDSLSVLKPEDLPPSHFDERGQYRWPKSIPMLRAWQFPAKPLIRDLLGKQLPQNARTQAVLLASEEADAIQGLELEEIELPPHPILDEERRFLDSLAPGGPTTGPVPSSWSGTVTRNADQQAFTYAFRFGKRDVWKIGCAVDVSKRLANFNTHVPHEVLGECWRAEFTQRWSSHKEAYQMEQRVLDQLRDCRTSGERVQCDKDKLTSAWLRGRI